MKDKSALLNAILEVTGIDYCAICSTSRKKEIVLARAIFEHEMRFTLSYTLDDIALCVNRTRSSVIHLTTKYNIDVAVLAKVIKHQKKKPDSDAKTKLIEYMYEFASIYGEYYHNGDVEKILEKVSEKIELPEKFLEKHFAY